MSTFNRVALWNTLCGKVAPEFGTPEYFDTLFNQSERIAEELEELREAIIIADTCSKLMLDPDCDTSTTFEINGKSYFVDQDTLNSAHQEILDAGCDLDVVVAGANFLSGHAYEPAIEAVLANNDAKYTADLEFARLSLANYGDGHSIRSTKVEMDTSQNDELIEGGFTTYISNGKLFAVVHTVHRDEDDKIMKLDNHPKVDLIPYTRTEG